jgi:hypothetical protein
MWWAARRRSRSCWILSTMASRTAMLSTVVQMGRASGAAVARHTPQGHPPLRTSRSTISPTIHPSPSGAWQ